MGLKEMSLHEQLSINYLKLSLMNTFFQLGFDFFSTIFEYMIKDYNKDGGGKYAEYYTPHAVAKNYCSNFSWKMISHKMFEFMIRLLVQEAY